MIAVSVIGLSVELGNKCKL